ncbi:MAG: FAD-binding oxidoreductase, partial [Cyanobacteria bacterium K_DeepCast_35m_m2_023]|nr:FAD-binding oxidoreductase [Cyanobacteria bacterium K_DeepCast_35m_m2_023]
MQRRGHQVTLIAPAQPTSSTAALGLLMAQVFHRASGRAWRLRQRSLALWAEWVAELQGRGHGLELKRGLLLLAASPDELNRQASLVEARTAMGLPLALWGRERLAQLHPRLPDQAVGGLWSANDGQIDPLPLLEALHQDCARLGVMARTTTVRQLRRLADHQWQLELADGTSLSTAWLVIC